MFLTILTFFLYLLAFATLSNGYIRPKLKGEIGERKVSHILREQGYPALNNLIIPNKSPRAKLAHTQIDHTIMTARGLLAIETKNRSGEIRGSAQDKIWRQTIGCQHYPFQNPLRQNWAHRTALHQQTGLPSAGLVVFTGSTKFPAGTPSGVTTICDLPKYLEKHYGLPNSTATSSPAWQNLIKLAASSKEFEKKHVQAVQTIYGKNYAVEGSILLAITATILLVLGHI